MHKIALWLNEWNHKYREMDLYNFKQWHVNFKWNSTHCTDPCMCRLVPKSKWLVKSNCTCFDIAVRWSMKYALMTHQCIFQRSPNRNIKTLSSLIMENFRKSVFLRMPFYRWYITKMWPHDASLCRKSSHNGQYLNQRGHNTIKISPKCILSSKSFGCRFIAIFVWK